MDGILRHYSSMMPIRVSPVCKFGRCTLNKAPMFANQVNRRNITGDLFDVFSLMIASFLDAAEVLRLEI